VTVVGADPDGLADLALALAAAADELDRRAAAIATELVAVGGRVDAGAAVAMVAAWCREQQADVVLRAVGLDDDAPLAALPGALADGLLDPGRTGLSVWSLVTTPGGVSAALQALRAGRPAGQVVPVLLPLSLVSNVYTVLDGDAAGIDRALAGVAAGADATTLYLLAAGASGGGLVVVAVVAGVVTAVQLWRSREDVADWLGRTGAGLEAGSAAADDALDEVGDWYETVAADAGSGVDVGGEAVAAWLGEVADDADDRGFPGLAVMAGVGAGAAQVGSSLAGGVLRGSGGVVARAADRAGDAMAAVGRTTRRATDWIADRLDGDDEDGDDGEDEAGR
jgi:hypothetical protein